MKTEIKIALTHIKKVVYYNKKKEDETNYIFSS